MSPRWRIIDTGAMDPVANMALDETLYRSYQRNPSKPTFRIYGWSTPSLSVGYSQDPDEDLDIELCRKRSVPFVRRITGGGIILHGNEITYSLVSSKEDLGIKSQVEASYRVISSFLISFYAAMGIDARFACDISPHEELGRSSAVCFAAKEKYDIVVDGIKIGGSAQKRSKEMIFQHGSIPLNFLAGRASSFTRANRPRKDDDSSATCLEELLGLEIKSSRLSHLLKTAFVKTFNLDYEETALSEEEDSLFAGLKAAKYETQDWNYHRVDRWKDLHSAQRG